MQAHIEKYIDKFPNAHLLVVGDLIVDHFIWGEVNRISPEAPVPVVDVRRENLMLGGAANVLHNIYKLGGKASLCGFIGEDIMATEFLKQVDALHSPITGVFKSDSRPTMVKTRVIVHNQQVVRFDREKRHNLTASELLKVSVFVRENLANYDAIVISDYAKGMICEELMAIIRENLKDGQPIIVDPKPGPGRLPLFVGASIVTPNHHEAEKLSGSTISNEKELVEAGLKILENLACDAALITRGESGMALFEKGKSLYSIPTRAREVYDVTGAGDTVVATLALGLASGMSYRDAACLANYAAGIVVGKVGTATVNGEELREAIIQ